MNEIEKLFIDDSREKKRTGANISKRASRKGYCRGGVKFPSDFLSAKERKKLSGEVRIYNMYDKYENATKDTKLDYKEFKFLDQEEQRKIFEILRGKFKNQEVAELFGASKTTIYEHMKKVGVEFVDYNKSGAKRKGRTKLITEFDRNFFPNKYNEIKGLDMYNKVIYYTVLEAIFPNQKAISKFLICTESSVVNSINRSRRELKKDKEKYKDAISISTDILLANGVGLDPLYNKIEKIEMHDCNLLIKYKNITKPKENIEKEVEKIIDKPKVVEVMDDLQLDRFEMQKEIMQKEMERLRAIIEDLKATTVAPKTEKSYGMKLELNNIIKGSEAQDFINYFSILQENKIYEISLSITEKVEEVYYDKE